uniref:Uncharacterized protein n=1 Tax=viral metagenome TaxID=1070528 RepID=A0A6H2A720_9ZZZZ
MKYQVTGQYYPDRQRNRNRGLSEGHLPIVFIPAGHAVFATRQEAEAYVTETFPFPKHRGSYMREYSEITEVP